jgi:hypothetical protein
MEAQVADLSDTVAEPVTTAQMPAAPPQASLPPYRVPVSGACTAVVIMCARCVMPFSMSVCDCVNFEVRRARSRIG